MIEAENDRPIIIIRKPTQHEAGDSNIETPNITTAFNDTTANTRKLNNDYLRCPKPTIYFNDGIRSVDYVLVWDAFEEEAVTDKAYQKRRIFEANLIKEGLEIEYEPQEKNGLNFIKVCLF